jgi:hypothetical protein
MNEASLLTNVLTSVVQFLTKSTNQVNKPDDIISDLITSTISSSSVRTLSSDSQSSYEASESADGVLSDGDAIVGTFILHSTFGNKLRKGRKGRKGRKDFLFFLNRLELNIFY